MRVPEGGREMHVCRVHRHHPQPLLRRGIAIAKISCIAAGQRLVYGLFPPLTSLSTTHSNRQLTGYPPTFNLRSVKPYRPLLSASLSPRRRPVRTRSRLIHLHTPPAFFLAIFFSGHGVVLIQILIAYLRPI